MKKFISLVTIFTLLLVTTTTTESMVGSTWTETRTVSYSGKSTTVNIFWTNLDNPYISVETALSTSGVGTVDSLETIVNAQTNDDGIAIGDNMK